MKQRSCLEQLYFNGVLYRQRAEITYCFWFFRFVHMRINMTLSSISQQNCVLVKVNLIIPINICSKFGNERITKLLIMLLVRKMILALILHSVCIFHMKSSKKMDIIQRWHDESLQRQGNSRSTCVVSWSSCMHSHFLERFDILNKVAAIWHLYFISLGSFLILFVLHGGSVMCIYELLR